MLIGEAARQEVPMLHPAQAAPAVLLDTVAGLSREAETLSPPPALLDGWASLTALDYERLALRIAAGLRRLRDAVHEATAALRGP